MNRKPLPPELDELISTHAPLNADPEFVSPQVIQALHDRQQALLRRTRELYGQTDGIDEPEEETGSPMYSPTYLVLLAVLAIAMFVLSLGVSAKQLDPRSIS